MDSTPAPAAVERGFDRARLAPDHRVRWRPPNGLVEGGAYHGRLIAPATLGLWKVLPERDGEDGGPPVFVWPLWVLVGQGGEAQWGRLRAFPRWGRLRAFPSDSPEADLQRRVGAALRQLEADPNLLTDRFLPPLRRDDPKRSVRGHVLHLLLYRDAAAKEEACAVVRAARGQYVRRDRAARDRARIEERRAIPVGMTHDRLEAIRAELAARDGLSLGGLAAALRLKSARNLRRMLYPPEHPNHHVVSVSLAERLVAFLEELDSCGEEARRAWVERLNREGGTLNRPRKVIDFPDFGTIEP